MQNPDTEASIYRTVVLKKNEVKVNGKTKLIIMITDVSATVLLKQDQLRKKKYKQQAQLA